MLFSTIIEKMNVNLADTVPKILEHLFGPTLVMISEDFNSFQDHRFAFYKFLQSITNHCFQGMILIFS
jgi:exportin-1